MNTKKPILLTPEAAAIKLTAADQQRAEARSIATHGALDALEHIPATEITSLVGPWSHSTDPAGQTKSTRGGGQVSI